MYHFYTRPTPKVTLYLHPSLSEETGEEDDEDEGMWLLSLLSPSKKMSGRNYLKEENYLKDENYLKLEDAETAARTYWYIVEATVPE